MAKSQTVWEHKLVVAANPTLLRLTDKEVEDIIEEMNKIIGTTGLPLGYVVLEYKIQQKRPC